MSAPYLRVLALALLLPACTTTNGPATTADADPAPSTVLKSPSQARRTPLPSSAVDSIAADYKGPQIIFTLGSAEIPLTATPLLDDIATKLKTDPSSNVVLVGHTEDLGSMEFSMAVASQCTQAVSQALIKRGAKSTQIRMQPLGYEKTAAKRCTSTACKKQMRHVDIVLSSY